MGDLVLTTFDWVPELPRGYVRDLRVRWALEEAGLPYRVESVPFGDRSAEHFAIAPDGSASASSSRRGSSTWSRCSRGASGWREPSPWPTSSWPTCCASSTGSTGWRGTPPVAPTSPAPPPARRSQRPTPTSWRISRRARLPQRQVDTKLCSSLDVPVLTLRNVATAGYRSLRSNYPVGRLEVFVGPNGVGKTNLYRGLELLHAAADNQLGPRLAQEGLKSALWAGPARRKGPVRITFAATLADEACCTEEYPGRVLR